MRRTLLSGGSVAAQRQRFVRRHRSLLAGAVIAGTALTVTLGTAQAVSAQAVSAQALTPGHSVTSVVGSTMLNSTATGEFTVPGTRSRTAYLGFQFRSPNASSGYRARARVMFDGAVWVGFSRVEKGQERLLSSKPTGVRVSGGQHLDVEAAVTGTSPVRLTMRAWIDGTPKPGWQQTTTDSGADRVTAAGPTRSWAYLSRAASQATTVALTDATVGPNVSSLAAPAPSQKPSASTTGVPAGTRLTPHYGDITVTKAGTVLDRMDIHGFVIVRAVNVKISNSIVRGGRSKGFDTGLITNYGYDNLLISDVHVEPEYPSVYFDGIKGWDYTARRVHVVGNVDSMKVSGDNVTVQDSLLENTTYFAHDPNQRGGPTHNDNIQILYGKNLTIVRNTIRQSSNFAILGAASRGNTNVVIDGNWLDGGHCTVKLQELNGWNENAVVTNNKFGPSRVIKNCAFQATPSVNLTDSRGNVYEANGSPVIPLRVNS